MDQIYLIEYKERYKVQSTINGQITSKLIKAINQITKKLKMLQ